MHVKYFAKPEHLVEICTVEYRFFKPPWEIEFGLKTREFQKFSGKNLNKANTRETTFGSKNQEFQKIKGSNNRDSTVY